MDAPEREQLPFGTTSTRALARLAPLGTELQVEFDVETRDEYGRILGYLWRDAPRGPLLVNWALVREGFAVVLTYPPNIRYTEALVEAQEAARTERRGLWAVDGFDCPPRDYRAGRCGG